MKNTMNKFIVSLILSILATAAMAQGMHTCTVNGRKVIQDRPCSLPKTGQDARIPREKTAAEIQAEFDAEVAKKREQEKQKIAEEEKRTQAKKTIADAQRECQEEKKRPSVVSNSSWDGSVSHVQAYFDRTLRDPSSFEAIKWGNVVHTCDGYTVAVTYRARNGFGGMTVASEVFFMDRSGSVVSVQL